MLTAANRKNIRKKKPARMLTEKRAIQKNADRSLLYLISGILSSFAGFFSYIPRPRPGFFMLRADFGVLKDCLLYTSRCV